MCGRLEAKLQELSDRQYNLLGRGEEDAADQVEREGDKYQELLECAVI